MPMDIRRMAVALALMAAACLALAVPAVAESLVSLQVGTYMPDNDFPGTAGDGGDFGIFYTNISHIVGFEVGVHGYGTSMEGWADLSVIGGEMLVTFQDPMAALQPYAGLGYGYYSIEVSPVFSPKDTGKGKGLVAEAGFRFFLDEMFLGLQVKGFRNKREKAIPSLKIEDFGGSSANIVLGILF